MRAAFTLIEIIFVLVVLGIIAAIGSEVLVKIYENYFLTRSTTGASYKLDVAALQISRLLSHRVRGSEVVRDGGDNLATMAAAGTQYIQMEWVAKAYEARRGMWDSRKNYLQPGWSGLADLLRSTKSTLVTPGSKLSIANEIIKNVYSIDMTADNSCAVVFYNTYQNSPLEAFGWDGSIPNAAYSVTMSSDTTFSFSDTNPKTISDIYDLACTAYAIRWHNGDLILFYDYQPWRGETYHNARSEIIIEDVTAFMVRKRDIDGAIQFRICVRENSPDNTEIELCTRKVVF